MVSRRRSIRPSDLRFIPTSRCSHTDLHCTVGAESCGGRGGTQLGSGRDLMDGIIHGLHSRGTCNGCGLCEGRSGPEAGGVDGPAGGGVCGYNLVEFAQGGGVMHKSSVEVKLEKVREEQRSDKGPAVEQNMGGNSEQGIHANVAVLQAPVQIDTAMCDKEVPASIVVEHATSMAEPVHGARGGSGECGVQVKISKRTGKPVRKYERKKKTVLPSSAGADGAPSFVGEVTAIIDKITEDLQEEKLQGTVGNHIPTHSDGGCVTPHSTAPTCTGKGKEKVPMGVAHDNSEGSGHRRGCRGRGMAQAARRRQPGNPSELQAVRKRKVPQGGSPQPTAEDFSGEVQANGERGSVPQTARRMGRGLRGGRGEPMHVAGADEAPEYACSDGQEELHIEYHPYSPPHTRGSGGVHEEPGPHLRRCLFDMRGLSGGGQHISQDIPPAPVVQGEVPPKSLS